MWILTQISMETRGLFIWHSLADLIETNSVTVDQKTEKSEYWLEVSYSFSTKP